MAIPPRFDPGSGWFRPKAPAAPGSLVYQAEIQTAAWKCVVFPMRSNGARLQGQELASIVPIAGWLVGIQYLSYPHWQVAIYPQRDIVTWAANLIETELVRENDGIRLYQGLQWVGEEKVRQTWLCAPTEAAGRAVLARM